MAAVSDKVLNWLYGALSKEYVDINRTYSDVAEALSQYRSLSVRTNVYTYESGQFALLVNITGTLPVTFRGVIYNFPIAVWVPHTYPQDAPMVYVSPSQEMLVRPGQHVSVDGKIYHPYLAQWGQYWDKSSLADFLLVLREVFAKEPPVISKQQAFRQPEPAQPTPPPPVPPPPEEWRRSAQQSPQSTPANAPNPPPKPPKPYATNEPSPLQPESRPAPPPKPYHSPQQEQGNVLQQSYRQQPPRPVQNLQQQGHGYHQHNQSSPHQPPRPHIQPPYEQGIHRNQFDSPVSPITPNVFSRGPIIQQLHQQHQRHLHQQQAPIPQAQPAFTRPTPQAQYAGHPQPPNDPRGQFLPPGAQQYQHPQQRPPQPKAPLPDLLDTPLDVTLPSQSNNILPAPPIPPNPEKDALLHTLSATLNNLIRNNISSNTSSVPALRSQQTALRTAQARLQSELDQLQQLDATLSANENIIREAMHTADRVMDETRRRTVPDVDEVLVAPTVVGGQLYNLCAEEKAIGDALFVLGRGLDRGCVGGETFVKQTRSLAREQFMKKALIKKIARGMGLDEFDYGR